MPTDADRKVCIACNEAKKLSDFYFRSDSGKHKNTCKKCCISGKKVVKSTTTKVCKHCGIEKEVNEFNKSGKWLQPYCKPCDSMRKKRYVLDNIGEVKKRRQKYYIENKDIISKKRKNDGKARERTRRWSEKNRERKKITDKEYRAKNRDIIVERWKKRREQNKEYYNARQREIKKSWPSEKVEKYKLQQKEWRLKNKDKIVERRKKYLHKKRERDRLTARYKSATDPKFKILKNLRSRIHVALKRGIKKSDTTVNLLGCSIPFFKEYFQSLFTEGMTWEAYMAGEIHIDHIIPCKAFDLSDESQQHACFYYKNLQPLWGIDNLKKGTKILEYNENR